MIIRGGPPTHTRIIVRHMAAPLIGQLTRHEIELTEVMLPSALSPYHKHWVLFNSPNNHFFLLLFFSMNGNIMVMAKEWETLCPGNIRMTLQSTRPCLRQISHGNVMQMTQGEVELYPEKTSWMCCMMFITFLLRLLMATSWGRAGNCFI